MNRLPFYGSPEAEPSSPQSPGRFEKYLKEQLRIQRQNLLHICRMCIKSIVDKAAFEAISDDCPHMRNLCVVLEYIFLHRMLPPSRWTFFSSSESIQFWPLILQYASPSSVSSIEDMENLSTDLGKSRAWLQLALVQKRLASFVSTLLSKTHEIKSLYGQGAFLLSEEMIELAGTLCCLDAIDFNLCLRNQDFDSGERYEVSYAPYLHFRQSSASKADDEREEKKLLDSSGNNARTSLQVPSLEDDAKTGKLGEKDGPMGFGGRGEMGTEAQLRELLKTEREQKNYFEELVSVRDTQLHRLQEDLDSLGRDSDQQKSDLESIILELQQQISKLEHELRLAHSKSQHSDSELTTASSLRRTGSFFSNLFGGRSGGDSI